MTTSLAYTGSQPAERFGAGDNRTTGSRGCCPCLRSASGFDDDDWVTEQQPRARRRKKNHPKDEPKISVEPTTKEEMGQGEPEGAVATQPAASPQMKQEGPQTCM